MNLPSGIHRADDAEINFNSRPKMIQMKEDRLLSRVALIVGFPFSSAIKVLSLNKGSRFLVWRAEMRKHPGANAPPLALSA